MTYRERRAARAERLRGWAEKRRRKSDASFSAAHNLAAQIPFGQPILVGHHSERRARRDAERIHNGIARGIEHQQKADNMTSRAAEIDRQADRSVYRDDPDAIEQLEARIADLEATRERRKTINREIRKGTGWEQRITPPLADEERADLLRAAQFSGTAGYPSYVFQNLSGSLTRQRARLAQLRQEQAATAGNIEQGKECSVSAEMKDTPSPIAEFAGALNPPAGALADTLPFQLTAETTAPAGPDEQPGLFPEDDTPCE